MSDHVRPDRTAERLVLGAQATGRANIQAAVHLLVFTDLHRRIGFDDLYVNEHVDRGDGVEVPALFIRDWKRLAAFAAGARLHSGAQRLIDLAVSLGGGVPVNLADAVNIGGHAHARRVIEAVAIATGYGEMFAVVPTPALDEMLAEQQRVVGG